MMAPVKRKSECSQFFSIITLLFCFLTASCTDIFLNNVPTVDGHLLNSYEMAIGQWDLRLHRRDKKKIIDIMFPPGPAPSPPGNTTEARAQLLSNANNNHVAKRQRNRLKPRGLGNICNKKDIFCCLTIKPDGTFLLEPIQEKVEEDRRLPIRGEWFLRSNPYCVTDRQYDTLVLLSYPRVKQIKNFDRQYALFELRCKLWGRYGMKTIRDAVGHKHGRSMGRLTHGTVLLVRREQHGDVDLRKTNFYVPRFRRRIICGTFCGKPDGNDIVTTDEQYAQQDDNWDTFENENEDDEQDDYFFQ